MCRGASPRANVWFRRSPLSAGCTPHNREHVPLLSKGSAMSVSENASLALAKRLGTTEPMLASWRRSSRGPAFIRVGRGVRHCPAAEDVSLPDQERQGTSVGRRACSSPPVVSTISRTDSPNQDGAPPRRRSTDRCSKCSVPMRPRGSLTAPALAARSSASCSDGAARARARSCSVRGSSKSVLIGSVRQTFSILTRTFGRTAVAARRARSIRPYPGSSSGRNDAAAASPSSAAQRPPARDSMGADHATAHREQSDRSVGG